MNFTIPDRQLLIFYAQDLCGGKFTPGIDNISAAENLNYFLLNGETVAAELADGSYRPKPALSFAVLKKSGKPRELSRFCAADTVIQRALAEIAEKQLEEVFSPYSFAYRKGKGTHTAVAQYCAYAAEYKYAVKIDPVACYDSINRSVLLKAMKKMTDNEAFLRLIKKYITVEVADEKGIHSTKTGILQGSPLSPVLCNVYFHELDCLLEEKKIPFCRYADDIVLFARSESGAARIANEVIRYLQEQLRLRLNVDKFAIARAEEAAYLGFRFERDETGRLVAREKHSDKRVAYTGDWDRTRKLRSSHDINLLSDGILTRREAAIAFETETGIAKLPLGAVEHLNVYGSVVFSPQVLQTLAARDISVSIFDKYGGLVGDFQPNRSFRHIATPLEQLEIYSHRRGMRAEYARDFLLSQLHNIRLNLSYQHKQYHSNRCTEVIAFIDEKRKELRKEKDIGKMLMAEAQVRQQYYSCFNEIIRAEDFHFDKRTRRPPRDEINALLSFSYTFLYNYIATEINKTSLDIRIAFLHAANSRQESLNLDIADVFKPLVADRTVFTLVNKRIIRKEHFETGPDGAVFLTAQGKRILLGALYDKLDARITVKEQSLCYAEIIQNEIRTLCADVRHQKKHRSFRQVR